MRVDSDGEHIDEAEMFAVLCKHRRQHDGDNVADFGTSGTA